MLLTDRQGIPIGVSIHSASPHEVTLIKPLLKQANTRLRSRFRLLYDKAADSQKLKWSLAALDIRLICPPIFRRNQKVRPMTKNEREHYQDRWKVERTFSWLKNFRRLNARWEYHSRNHLGFWQLGCLFTILKRF